MGKEGHRNPRPQDGAGSLGSSSSSSVFFCRSCSARISREVSFRCVAVLVLSLFLLVSGILLILPSPNRASTPNSFDADGAIKLGALVHASFQLEKPVSQLLPQIQRLEYDIFSEISVPDTKVAILSMHPSGASNRTDVVFGVLSDPLSVPISAVSLSILRSSLVELFLKDSNLTLTNSTFGQPFMFEILKFPGGITVIPTQYSIWQLPDVLFNFTLNNSISEILDNLSKLKFQLKSGLSLRPYETVFVQITSVDGSTTSPPVTVQASVMSNFGSLLPQRLRQLAQTIKESHAENLGLDNLLFGKVKSVILSSYLLGTLDATAPIASPAPAPSPQLSNCAEPPKSQYPALSPSPPLAPSPTEYDPCPRSRKRRKRSHHHPSPPTDAPNPSTTVAHSPDPCPYVRQRGPPCPLPSHSKLTPNLSPADAPLQPTSDLSPIPGVSHGSRQGGGTKSPSVAPSPVATSPSSSAMGPFHLEVRSLGSLALLIVCLLCWPY